jgi:hypothetical protein
MWLSLVKSSLKTTALHINKYLDHESVIRNWKDSSAPITKTNMYEPLELSLK